MPTAKINKWHHPSPSAGNPSGPRPSGDHCPCNTIRPPKAVLKRILATAAGPNLLDVIFLHNLAARLIAAFHGRDPGVRNPSCQIFVTIARQSIGSDPLQGRPAIGTIPLLSRFYEASVVAARDARSF
jgi:hypothetical protein